MASYWTKDEVFGFLSKANPYVRLFFKALTKVEGGSISALKVPATSVAMSMRAFNILKKKPLFTVDKSEKPPIYSIDDAYKKAIANFFSKFKEPRMAKKKVRRKKVVRKKATRGRKKRRVGRPAKAAGSIPVSASSKDLKFWVNFAQAFNSSKGKQLVVETDGKSINLKMSR